VYGNLPLSTEIDNGINRNTVNVPLFTNGMPIAVVLNLLTIAIPFS
jgi:hypothetical protein